MVALRWVLGAGCVQLFGCAAFQQIIKVEVEVMGGVLDAPDVAAHRIGGFAAVFLHSLDSLLQHSNSAVSDDTES